ncbi:MAG: hypothetical protein KIT62_12770 [Cyclobacteriaceae bacterium]|nr:hypothetical protein [Cyclobacteriaceae bacterium]
MATKLIEKIKRTPDFEDEKTQVLFKGIGDIKKQGYLTKEQGIKILKWKSPRPLRHYQKNSEEDFLGISKIAFNSTDERIRIHILTALNGVNYPAASAILMFYDKTKYPIIDIRVWKQLYKAGLVDTNERGQGFRLKEWEKYLEIIRALALKMNLTPRQVEKRLFDIDRNEQEQIGNLYQ